MTKVTHFGRLESGGAFDFLEDFGGPILQQASVAGCGEQIPPQANHIRRRVTPSVLAFGLVEAIPDAALAALEDPDDSDGDGVSGRVHWVHPLGEPAGSPLRAGRFGWKSQIATVRDFSGDALRTEMGVTNRVVPDETPPNGIFAPPSCQGSEFVEDRSDAGLTFVDATTAFQRYLAPPPQAPRTGMRGEQIFNAIGCAKCHGAVFTTPDSPELEAALRGVTIRPYGDFLLHDMGDMDADGIGDGIPDGDAGRFEMRTPPLWNLRTRPVLLHDASAVGSTLEERVELAVARHGGEGSLSRAAFATLSSEERADLFRFLDSLGRDDFDATGDGLVGSSDLAIIAAAVGRAVSPDEPAGVADLDGNGEIGADEVAALRLKVGGAAADGDCNQNGIDDLFEIADGWSEDSDSNGIPDECDQLGCGNRIIRTVVQAPIEIPALQTTNVIREIVGALRDPQGNLVTGQFKSARLVLAGTHRWQRDLDIDLRRGTTNLAVYADNVGTGCAPNTVSQDRADLLGIYRFQSPGFPSASSEPRLCAVERVAIPGIPEPPPDDTGWMLPPGSYRSQVDLDAPAQGTIPVESITRWGVRVRDLTLHSDGEDGGRIDFWMIDVVYKPALTEIDCDQDGVDDLCAISFGVVRDDNGNSLPDSCDIAGDPALDCNGNGYLDAGPDGALSLFEIEKFLESDCNSNGIPDSCELTALDSDGDGTLDPCDGCPGDPDKIAPGDCGCGQPETDSDLDGVPNCVDNCVDVPNTNQLDSDGDGVGDACAVFEDCNGNGIDDLSDIAGGSETDCNGNSVPDSCELAEGSQTDCNSNDVLDACEIASGSASDCNSNGLPDACDISSGTESDLDGNGVPDSCSCELIVGGTGFAGIAEAIAAAPAGATVLVAPGTYLTSTVISERPVTLRSIGGAASKVLDGKGASGSILNIRSPAVAGTRIEGFTFRNGLSGSADLGFMLGGAILLAECTADIVDCRFEGNRAPFGGAVYGYRYQGSIEGCVFSANEAVQSVDGGDGGAIILGFGGNWTIRDCIFTSNVAGFRGGALHMVQLTSGAPTNGTIIGCEFRENTSNAEGSAISWFSGSGQNLRLESCLVTANNSLSGSGAVVRTAGALSFELVDTTVCQNEPSNIVGPVIDLGGNTFGEGCGVDCSTTDPSLDCNGNGLLDSCDIASGASEDCDGDGIPDGCALSAGAVAFGDDLVGQATIPAGTGLHTDAAAGCDHTALLLDDGRVACFGSNAFGQCDVPAGLDQVVRVAAGCGHTVALRADGTVVCWGANDRGQCDVPAGLGTVVQIAAGEAHTAALRANGSVVCWGRNLEGQCDIPAGLGTVVQVAAGGAHTLALRADGTVAAWGHDNFGQRGVPAGLSSVVRIAAGCYHSVALRADGTVAAWGANFLGQSDVPAGLSGVVDVAAGVGQHTLCLKADGSVVGFGWNAFGQTSVPAGTGPVRRVLAGGSHSVLVLRGSGDCDGDGDLDACEIAGGAEADCNANGIPDACELRDGAETDLDDNGRPDSCDLVVGGSGFATIQAAVDAAPQGSTILVGPGTYGRVDLTGRAVTLVSTAGANSTFIDGGGANVCFQMSGIGPGPTVLIGFTLRNGTGTNGGGATIVLASPTFRECVFESNTASSRGGAAACVGSGTRFVLCTFRYNFACQGGALFIQGTSETGQVVVDRCVFESNEALSTAGAILNEGQLLINGTSIEGNIAGVAAGGVQFSSSGLAYLVDSRFCRNVPGNFTGQFEDLGGNAFGDDCDGNGICDLDEIASGTAADCNGNDVIDACEIASGTASDCNGNGAIDACDLALGTSTDLDGNGILDDCAGEFVVGGSGFTTVQAAIDAAPDGTTIRVAAGTYGAIVLASRSLELVSIDGAADTVLDGGGSRVVDISGQSA